MPIEMKHCGATEITQDNSSYARIVWCSKYALSLLIFFFFSERQKNVILTKSMIDIAITIFVDIIPILFF